MRWITGLLGGLWRISRASWADVGHGLRPGSGASTLYVFLFLVFLIIGGVLMLLGVSLNDADRWIDAQGSWLDRLASVMLRIVFALVLLLCAGMVAIGLGARLPGRGARSRVAGEECHGGSGQLQGGGRIGWGAMALALLCGYFAAIGAFGHY